MKFIAVVLTTFMLFSSFAMAEELTPAKKESMKELMVLTGASQMGQMFGNAFVQQLTTILKSTNPDIDPKAFVFLEEEINKLIREELVEKKTLQELIYPLYHKYLTHSDIKELIRFYKTPVGKKAISVMPQLTRESMQAGQKWGQALGPVIQQRIKDRFKREGISIEL